MRALVTILAVAALIVLGANVLGRDRTNRSITAVTAATSTVASRAVPAPRPTARQIDRQDRPDPRRQRREARAFDSRPLLAVLPTTLDGVRFEIGGLAAGGRATIIRASARGLGGRAARIAYDTLRRQTGDRSRSYLLEIEP
jgi:hypothetical protein